VPQTLLEAGLDLEFQEDGTRLIVRDADPQGCAIRSRGGEAVARLLKECRGVRALDVRESSITDNGIGQLCLALRQTNQLQELSLSPVGHAGLRWLLGVLRQCDHLRTVRFEVRDVPTLYAGRQTIEVSDFDTSGYVPPPPAEDEEEDEGEEGEEGEDEAAEEDAEDDEGDEEAAERRRAAKRAAKLRAKFADNRNDSGDEGEDLLAAQVSSGASKKLLQLLTEFVSVARKRENLHTVECLGDLVPEDVALDLERALQDHRDAALKQEGDVQEAAGTNMHANLGGKKEALLSDLLQIAAWAQRAPAEEDDSAPASRDGKVQTRLGLRHFLGQTLVAPLGEALFECQRFKSKENEAVSTPEGEMAFVAMYLRMYSRGGAQNAL